MTPNEGKELFNKIRINRKRLDNCRKHHFDIGEPPYRLGQVATCWNCGGEMPLLEIGAYVRGYKAAGGVANDIVQGYE